MNLQKSSIFSIFKQHPAYGTVSFKNTNKKTRLSAQYIGRGRWSRTTDNGVKVRCLTAWLYPHYGKWILSCKPYRFV